MTFESLRALDLFSVTFECVRALNGHLNPFVH